VGEIGGRACLKLRLPAFHLANFAARDIYKRHPFASYRHKCRPLAGSTNPSTIVTIGDIKELIQDKGRASELDRDVSCLIGPTQLAHRPRVPE
jgi:hypothetical protein